MSPVSSPTSNMATTTTFSWIGEVCAPLDIFCASSGHARQPNRSKVPIGILLLLGCLACPLLAQKMSKGAHTSPIHVKVVVVAMFEVGEDTGDIPGEYQLWVEREHLDQVLPLSSGYRHVRMNKEGVLGMVTGVGTAKAAASVMALGLDARFDLSKAFWIVAGIGGGDPAD